MPSIGRVLILIGALIFIVGIFITLLGEWKIPIGRLPGDFRFQIGNVACFVPLASTLLLSILLTIVLNVIVRFLNR